MKNPPIFNLTLHKTMPNLGDTSFRTYQDKKGYATKNTLIWATCEQCGRQRWVLYTKGRPVYLLCISCGQKKNKNHLGHYGPYPYKYKPTKICRKCGVEYPNTIKFFKPCKQTKSGLGSPCRFCLRKEKRQTLKARLSQNISNQISQSLKGRKNGHHWESLVGYAIDDLIQHLEKQFKDGMNWQNYGVMGWVIDHKIPQVAFNFSSSEDIDFKRCWALSNLQPMWFLENSIKSATIAGGFQPSLIK